MLQTLPLSALVACCLLALPALAETPSLTPFAAGQPPGQGRGAPPVREASSTPLAEPRAVRTSPSAAGEVPPSGQELVAAASRHLLQQPSISCKIRQKIDLYGQQLVGVGAYQQLRPASERLLRLDLKLQLHDQATSLTQVADGRFLWIRRELPRGTQLSRVDLRQLETATPGKGKTPPDPMTYWLVLGGLPKLLAGLESNFQFGSPQPSQLSDVPVWLVEGTWRRERLHELLPAEVRPNGQSETEPAKLLAALPPHLPQGVLLVLGRDDLFPYRIEYRRFAEKQPADAPSAAKAIVAMELFEVQLGGALDRSRFTYQPGDTEVVDQTGFYLQSLGLRTAAAEAPRTK